MSTEENGHEQDHEKLGKKNVSMLKTGKAPAVADANIFKLAPIMRAGLPKPPERYSFYDKHPEIPQRDWKNKEYGTCVVAGACNFITGAEKLEQGIIVPITDAEVMNTYWSLTGGVDSGLVVVDFLKHWRNNGLNLAGRNYKIHGYASINWKNTDEVKWAIIANVGVFMGLLLPVDAADQFQRGVPWTVTDGPGGRMGGWGGHLVLGTGFDSGRITGYTEDFVVVDTWAERHLVSWPFLRNCDEMHAIFDKKNSWNTDIIPSFPEVDPPTPRPYPNRVFSEGSDVAVGVVPGMSHDQVTAYFATVGGVNVNNKEDVDDVWDVEYWKVGRHRYAVKYDANTGYVHDTTYQVRFYA